MADPNPFDQFDAAPAATPSAAPAGNPFDQFDAAPENHTWTGVTPQGKKITFQAPPDADQETLRRAVLAAGGTGNIAINKPGAPPPQTDDSAGRGLLLGAMKPLDQAAGWIDSIPGVHDVNERLSNALGIRSDSQANADDTAARQANSRTGFQSLGNAVGTAPTLMLPGGALAQGAAAGALTSDRQGAGTLLDAGIGALTNFGAKGILEGLGTAIAPRVSQGVSYLKSLGINPSPGQALRDFADNAGSAASGAASRFLATLEDHATSLPYVQNMITGARQVAKDGFNRAGVSQALSKIGETLPDAIQTGHGAVAYTRRTVSNFYDKTLENMHMIPDAILDNELQNTAKKMTDGTLNADAARQFQASVRSKLGWRGQSMREVPGTPFMAQDSGNLPAVMGGGRDVVQSGGTGVGPYIGDAAAGTGANGTQPARYMSGETLKRVDSELRKQASSTSDVGLRDMLNEVRMSVRNAAKRSSPPEMGAQLDAADNAWAHYSVLRDAASKADGGMFTPGQLDNSSRISDTTIGKRASSEGTALYQDLSETGRRVLTGKTGDSGTFTRAATFNPFYHAVGAAGALVYPLAQKATARAGTAGPNAVAAAALLRSLAPAAGAIAAPTSVQALSR